LLTFSNISFEDKSSVSDDCAILSVKSLISWDVADISSVEADISSATESNTTEQG